MKDSLNDDLHIKAIVNTLSRNESGFEFEYIVLNATGPADGFLF
jgi:hypothetical protein